MRRVVELPPFKPGQARHQGLLKLSPDLISKARDETASQVTRIGLTFVGTAAFCLLSLLSPDTALLGESEKINVPFAGPVSFFGFMLLGPAVLIVMRVYLQIYVEHSDRLERLARSVSVVRAPTLVPLKNSLIRLFSGLIFYMLLPAAMMLFAWKAAAFPHWGVGLSIVAVAVIASHLLLWFSRLSWRSIMKWSVGAAIIAFVMLVLVPLRRPLDLYHANLSGQWLKEVDLREANLEFANLSDVNLFAARLAGAHLNEANLSRANLAGIGLSGASMRHAVLANADLFLADLRGAYLFGADLSRTDLRGAKLIRANLSGGVNLFAANLGGADLSNARLGGNLTDTNLGGANLSGADLHGANLRNADLSGADLSSADLDNADLSSAKNLTQAQLDKACGDADTKLPERLTLKRCEAN